MTDKYFPFTDEEILRWEQKRGTMPEPEKLGTEWLRRPWHAPQVERLVISIDTAKGAGSGSDGLDMERGGFDVDATELFG